MSNHPPSTTPSFVGSKSFILLLALLMGLYAFFVDAILPAFPQISTAFQLSGERANQIQDVLLIFFSGYALAQIPVGILTDRFGRKPVLLVGVAVLLTASLIAAWAPSYGVLLGARAVQGAAMAVPRTVCPGILRDTSQGNAFGKNFSFVMTFLFFVPIVSPTLGTWAIALAGGHWQGVFYLCAGLLVVLLIWASVSLPETLPPERRTQLAVKPVFLGIKKCVSHKPTLLRFGVSIAAFTTLLTYLTESNPIINTLYGQQANFHYLFPLTTGGMILASYLNAQLVMKFGMNRLVFLGILAMIGVDLIFFGSVYAGGGKIPLAAFLLLLNLHLFCFATIWANINPLIINPHPEIAGTASALNSTLTTYLAVKISSHFIVPYYHGTLYTIATAFLVCGVVALLVNLAVHQIEHRGAKTSPADENSGENPATKN